MNRHEHFQSEEGSTLKCELAAEVLRAFGSLRFSATGWSMIPTILPHDTLVIAQAHADTLCVGDIALVARAGRLCAHRLVEKKGGKGNRIWITQGDAMPHPDDPVSSDQLLGQVTHLVRNGAPVAIAPKLGLINRLVAAVVRRSLPAARAFLYLNRIRFGSEEPAIL